MQSAAGQRWNGRLNATSPDAHSVTENSPIWHYGLVISAAATGSTFGMPTPAEPPAGSDSNSNKLRGLFSGRAALLPSQAATALPTASGLDHAALRPWISRPQSALIPPCAPAAASKISALLSGGEQGSPTYELAARGARWRRRRGSTEPALGGPCDDLLAGKIAAILRALPRPASWICDPITIATAPWTTPVRVGENPTKVSVLRPRPVLGPCRSESVGNEPMGADAWLSKIGVDSHTDICRIEQPADKAGLSVAAIRPPSARALRPTVHPIEPDTSALVRWLGSPHQATALLVSIPPRLTLNDAALALPGHPDVPHRCTEIFRWVHRWLAGICPGRIGDSWPMNPPDSSDAINQPATVEHRFQGSGCLRIRSAIAPNKAPPGPRRKPRRSRGQHPRSPARSPAPRAPLSGHT